MLVKAKKTFGGRFINMKRGEVRELPMGEALLDLLRCGYVAETAPEKPQDVPETAEVKDDGSGNKGKRGNSRKREESPAGGL
ncbi:MAG: hypothetical protein NC078_12665 [Ruminococcus sp.]|nr:hypothetical protein [Ruminococcus sp.]